MADSAPQFAFALTEADIEALVDNGTIEIERDPEPDPLVGLTRRLAAQYVDRFSDWADAPDDVQTDMAMRALADVDRLAASSGDSVLQRVLATLPRRREGAGWPTFLRTWVDRLGGVLGMTEARR